MSDAPPDDSTEKNPPLADVSESELSALVEDVLKSGKSLTAPPATHAPPSEGEQERMHARVIASQMRELARQISGEVDVAFAASTEQTEEKEEWWFESHGRRLGPLNLRKIRYLWEEGELTPDSLCWREGFTAWVSLFRISELAQALAPKRVEPEMIRAVAELVRTPTAKPAEGWQPSAGAKLELAERQRLMGEPPPAEPEVPPPPPPALLPLTPDQPAGLHPTIPAAPPPKRGFHFGNALVSGLVSGAVIAGALVAMRYYAPTAPKPPVVVAPPPAAAPAPPTPPVPAPQAVAPAPAVARAAPEVPPSAPRPAAPGPAPAPRPAPSNEASLTAHRAPPHGKPETTEEAFASQFQAATHEARELSTVQIMTVVVQHKAAVDACVRQQHAAVADSTGRLVMRWTVHTDGTVSNVEAKPSEDEASALSSCLVQEIPKWRFPEHDVAHPPVEIPFVY